MVIKKKSRRRPAFRRRPGYDGPAHQGPPESGPFAFSVKRLSDHTPAELPVSSKQVRFGRTDPRRDRGEQRVGAHHGARVSGSGRIRIQDGDLVRVLTIDNPQKRNAFDYGSLAALADACAAAARERVRCIVIRGAGDQAFSSGFDIDAMGGDGIERPDVAVERTMEAVDSLPCPTIAYLNGSAFGAGCELAAACDLRVARDGVQLGMPPAKLGVVYAASGLRRFVALLGPSRAREMFFTGRPVEAGRALQMGFVNRVVPMDQAEAETLALASEIAQNAPLAVQGMKRILRLLEATHERGLTPEEREEVAELRRRAFDSADLREGREAFRDKRPPRFRGE